MGKRYLSDPEVQAQIPAARRRAQRARVSEPRAKSARYDPVRGLIVVELTNGAFFGFPARLAQGLRGAAPGRLAEIEISPSGEALHWERLDADLRVGALLQGVFGTRAWMRELGRAGGRARSAAKTQAARLNGAKGGRPRKRSVP
ncbi:MAG: DUF2442 domain-containing protein [Gemmatimonadales bacterium]